MLLSIPFALRDDLAIVALDPKEVARLEGRLADEQLCPSLVDFYDHPTIPAFSPSTVARTL